MLLLTKTEISKLRFRGLSQSYKELGVKYLGNVNHSSKLIKGVKKNYSTYGIYLAPSNISGFNVCSNDKYCKDFCLYSSGLNKLEIWGNKYNIQNSRIKKSILYSVNNEYFTQMVISEIKKYKLMAELDNMEFCVRINCTSDINLETLTYRGKNILEMFENIRFYEYTKNTLLLPLINKYPNLHYTLSYSGYNWQSCEKALKNGINTAVVFESEHLPKTFKGYKVINGDETDLRFLDAKGVIVGLKYKINHRNRINNKIVIPDTKFIIKFDNPDCVF